MVFGAVCIHTYVACRMWCLVQCAYVVCDVCVVWSVVWSVRSVFGAVYVCSVWSVLCEVCGVWCSVLYVCGTGVDLYLLSVSRFDLQSEVNEKLLEFKLDIGPSSAGRAVQMAANEQ